VVDGGEWIPSDQSECDCGLISEEVHCPGESGLGVMPYSAPPLGLPPWPPDPWTPIWGGVGYIKPCCCCCWKPISAPEKSNCLEAEAAAAPLMAAMCVGEVGRTPD